MHRPGLPARHLNQRLPAPIAVVDIGSNSIYLLVARVDGASIEYLERSKVSARLAAALGPDGRLSEEAVELTLSSLSRFREVAARHGAGLRVAATAAMRAAANRAEILARSRAQGVEIELVSGAEEARLTYLGALNGLPELRDERIVCVDIGGGSTEILVGEGGRALLTASVAVGSLRASRLWLGPDPVGPAAVRRATREIARRLELRPFRLLGFRHAVATAAGVLRVVRRVRETERLDVPRATLDGADVDGVARRLEGARTRAERLALPGMDPDRVDSVLGGALILQRLTRELGVPSWTVSMSALRTGLLVDTAQRLRSGDAS